MSSIWTAFLRPSFRPASVASSRIRPITASSAASRSWHTTDHRQTLSDISSLDFMSFCRYSAVASHTHSCAPDDLVSHDTDSLLYSFTDHTWHQCRLSDHWPHLLTFSFIHSFLAKCIALNIDITFQSGRFWATTIASFRERLFYFRSCWIVFIHVVLGRPASLLQFSRGGGRLGIL